MKLVELTVDNENVNNFRVGLANTAWLRLRGLLGRTIDSGFGLLIKPCSSIHTMWMGYPIDAVFVDKAGTVTDVYENLKPWRMASSKAAYCVLELESGNAERLNIKVGSKISW
ncbi:DUF192 domain-containing protein [Pseudoalteromonas sp. T1lg24]|uniref:DUF192 domain-containing protein n=1 Tax=Pseudoalteromonas sp. T1lg24 TaxID=2077099 RepID=UPI000CF71E8D|nr:DUF192 domain-containing protein [Pseudoalteromonas sp. T1lg24]